MHAAWLERGPIRTRLMAALVLLALLPILLLAVSLAWTGRMTGDARRIEVAGGLRMSGFIIAAQLNSHIAHPAPYKQDIVEDELARMDEILHWLEGGPDAERDPEAMQRVVEARHALRLYREVTGHVFERVRRGFASPREREDSSQEVLGSAYGLLALTNRLAQGIATQSSQALQRLRMLQAIAVAVALAITMVTLWAVDRHILQPIPSLLAAFGAVRAGRYGTTVAVRSEDEFGHLAHAFNAMSAELESVHHALVLQQSEILEKNAALERAAKLKSQFIANMSHELRTPLNAIIGYTKLLRDGVYGEFPAAARQPLAGIDETSATLLSLINDILDVARIEAGRMDLHLETLRVEDVVRQVAEMVRPLALAKGLELVIDDTAALPNVTTDRDKLRRILLNLAGNAIKFTRHGRVEIVILPPAASPGVPAEFEIAVRDTGIGIPAADLNAIFEDFRQVDGSSTREHGGTGLGLAISRRLARHLGGDIRVESRLGAGSTFTLRLPVFVHVDAGAGGAVAIPRGG
jgi:signal transduction histidine kinase